jgi:hypothetical protein
MKKLRFLLVSVLVIGCGFLNAQNASKTSGFIQNSVYSYAVQKSDASSETTIHNRLYQTLRLDVRPFSENISFHFSGRALTDLNESDLQDVKRFKAYRLSVSGKRLFHNFLDFELGRQFLYPGILLGSLDGLNVLLKPWRFLHWQVYGGIESHLFRAFKMYEPAEATVLGTRLMLRNVWNSNLHLVYLQKLFHSQTQWQIAGINFSNYSVSNLVLYLQAHYDLANSRLHRFYLSARYRLGRKWMLSGYLKQQYPQVYQTSYFSTFEIEKYLLSGFDVAYQVNEQFSVTGAIQGVQLKEGYGTRMIVSLGSRCGSVGFVYEMGDLGNQLGVLADYRLQVLPKLRATFHVDYSRYRFEKQYDYDSQLANAIGVSYQFSRHWSTRLEYQWLSNARYQYDQRVLNHINFIW